MTFEVALPLPSGLVVTVPLNLPLHTRPAVLDVMLPVKAPDLCVANY